MTYYHVITVDIASVGDASITLKQGDSGRNIIIYPTANGQPWPIPDNAIVSLRLLNPLRQSVEIPAGKSTHNGKECIEVNMTAEATSVVGVCVADATISVDGEIVSTLNFRIVVQPAPTSRVSIPSSGGTTDYRQLSNKPSINGVELSGNVELSQLGIPTGAEFDSKVQAAQAAATNAQNSAAAAGTHASNAAESASDAYDSAFEAAQSKTTAVTAASSASASADSAANSEGDASTSAASAASSASAAAASAAAAKVSETAAISAKEAAQAAQSAIEAGSVEYREYADNAANDAKYAAIINTELRLRMYSQEQNGVSIRPKVLLFSDDGTREEFAILFQIALRLGIPICLAIPVESIGSSTKYCGWPELAEMFASGLVTFAIHGNKPLRNSNTGEIMTAEELIAVLDNWFGEMEAHKLLPPVGTPIVYAYPTGTNTPELVEVIKGYSYKGYKVSAGYTVIKGADGYPSDLFNLHRVGIFPQDGSYDPDRAYNDYVLPAAKAGKMVALFWHTYMAFDADAFEQLIKRIRELGVDIVSPEQAMLEYAAFDVLKNPPASGGGTGGSTEPVEVWELVELKLTYNRSISSAGVVGYNQSANNCVTQYIDVTGKSKARVSGTAYKSTGMYAFFDSNEDGAVALSAVYQSPDNIGGAAAKFGPIEIDIPDSASYMVVSGSAAQQLPVVELMHIEGGDSVDLTQVYSRIEELEALTESQASELALMSASVRGQRFVEATVEFSGSQTVPSSAKYAILSRISGTDSVTVTGQGGGSGKNLYNKEAWIEYRSIDSVGTDRRWINGAYLEAGKTYTVSFSPEMSNPTENRGSSPYIYVGAVSDAGFESFANVATIESGGYQFYVNSATVRNTFVTFTLKKDAFVFVYGGTAAYQFGSDVAQNNRWLANVQIEEGSEATTYEPYGSGGGSARTFAVPAAITSMSGYASGVLDIDSGKLISGSAETDVSGLLNGFGDDLGISPGSTINFGTGSGAVTYIISVEEEINHEV